MSALRRCTTCREPWPLECFARDPRSPGGRERRCKACRYERRDALAAGAARARPWALRVADGRARPRSERERAAARARKAARRLHSPKDP